MKRILAMALAALMILGMFAIGVSALEADDPETAVLQEGEFEGLSTTQKGKIIALLADFTNYMNKEQVNTAAALVIALQFSQDSAEALKDPAKEVEFNQKVAAALGNVDLAFGDTFQELIDAFLADEEAAIVEAFLAGTLQSDLRTLFSAYLTGFIAEVQPLVDTYVKKDVADAAAAYAKVLLLFWDIKDNTVWTTANKKALEKALNDFMEYVKKNVKDFINSGKMIEFTAEINRVVAALKGEWSAIVAALNTARADLKTIWDSIRAAALKWWQKLPGFLAWFLRWVCFGWIWMR